MERTTFDFRAALCGFKFFSDLRDFLPRLRWEGMIIYLYLTLKSQEPVSIDHCMVWYCSEEKCLRSKHHSLIKYILDFQSLHLH